MTVNNYKEDEKSKDSINLKTLLRLLSYTKAYKKSVALILFFMAIIIGVEMLNPYILKVAIDDFIRVGDMRGLLILASFMALINIVSAICFRQRIVRMTEVSSSILRSLREQLYTHIQRLSFSFFDNRPVGKILARVIGDVNSLDELFTSLVIRLIPDAIMLVTLVLIMLIMNFQLGLVSLITLPFLGIFLTMIQIKARKKWQGYRKKRSNFNAYIHEAYSGIRVIQSFSKEEDSAETFYDQANEVKKSFMGAVKISNMFWPLVELSWALGSIIVFYYGVRLQSQGTISVGLLVAFLGYSAMFWRPIMNLSNFYNTLVTSLTGADRIFEIMDMKEDIKDIDKAIEMPVIKGEVTFDNVSFSYDREDAPVLRNVSFSVGEGTTVALVGHTGAGKTTIVNLLSRFYDPKEGIVKVDGYDIKEVGLESLRSQMGVMTQDTFLFSGTIADNIRYGKLDATMEEVIEAAKVVQAHDFIVRLEKGYETDVNERGSRLSVGQRQLIALARALLANPRILILDEATASIDTATERLVQRGLEKLFKGRTSFVIAHRLSTIRNADVIMVIDDGRIIEKGKHEELMEAKGKYYELHTTQYKFLTA